jgi:UDP-N-acetylglucosamine--N-acetylmuramyl-(pentapeptide) pyrophosphoryl-undecaprenol N-acetylglucosamine transferase
MKILLTGGGTGGHFYPLIAVSQALRKEVKKQKYIEPEIHFISDSPYNESILFDNRIVFHKVPAGKIRLYFSPLNIIDWFKTGIGSLKALIILFKLYPDVIFSKGGYSAFPTLLAAKILKIPVVIHESDTVPGKVNRWSGKFAKKIAVSYPEAIKYFDEEKTAWTGNPVRDEIATPAGDGAHEFLDLEKDLPTILILGGSQGAQFINDSILIALPDLLKNYQIVHQVGPKNEDDVLKEVDVVLEDPELIQYKKRYKVFGTLNDLATKMSAGVADLIITRAGSSLFEIARWGIPSIIVPISNSNGDHQRTNAYTFSRATEAVVIEEQNMNSSILISEINRILDSKETKERMSTKAKEFAKVDAAEKISKVILQIASKHEK